MGILIIWVYTSVVDRHCFDADPDPNFHFDADPHPDPELQPNDADTHTHNAPSFTHVGKYAAPK
jgi:hypothetical protein